VDAWQADPFIPFAIARGRLTAFQKAVVMKYLDNLIGWGDQLFRRNTRETINQATQLYVLAAQILGDRPEEITPSTNPAMLTWDDLAESLDEFSNLLENALPSPTEGSDADASEPLPTLPGLYFSIPPNDKLLGYWDTVEDRLFKIRSCMNIEGVVQQLPLFEPPIDPALLVRAAALGVDLTSALSDLDAPVPFHRFAVMIERVKALCGSVRSLGAALQQALERGDAAELEALRSQHEQSLLSAMRALKSKQITEAEHELEALQKGREVTVQRRGYYQGLISDGLKAKSRRR
jgi:hypothetical protein